MYLAEKEGKAKGEKIMNRKHFYTAVILLSFLIIGIQPAFAIKQIIDDGPDGTGGDATSIGIWDWGTLTCTLTQDVYETIQIMNDGITLDGSGGGTVNGVSGTGVDLAGRQYVTVKNLNVTGCDSGIALNPSGYCNLINDTISGCQAGIHMWHAGTHIIEGNIISDNDTGIQIWSGCVNNIINDNTIEDNNVGLSLSNSEPQYPSKNNTIYNNNFINNTTWQAYVTSTYPNYFNLSKAEGGGNYWSCYIGLDDGSGGRVAGDGIGDTDIPYLGLDHYPFMVEDGWITAQVLIGQLVTTVAEMNLQQGIDNSLDAKLDAAFNALEDINNNNDVAAINSLNAFINAVEAQRGSKITDEQADELNVQAQAIITKLSAG